MRVQQRMEIVLPIYSRKRKRREPAFWGEKFSQELTHTNGHECKRLAYRSATVFRFWLFITSRRLSKWLEV